MKVKKFVGDNINQAVARMKSEFGRDAVILHTKRIKYGGFFGFFGRFKYEVIGAIDPIDNQPLDEANLPRQSLVRELHQDKTSVKSGQPGKVNRNAPPNPGHASTQKVDSKIWPESIQEVYEQMIARDIPKDVSQALLKEVLTEVPKTEWQDVARIWSALNKLVSSRISTVDPWTLDHTQKVVVLIGPTGVGKTTTIAKLAANFALVAEKKVGLITVDTYRIAAVEQLKTYADIIGVPVHVAYSPRELTEAVRKLQDRELVLVDTAGRSHRNRMHMAELKTFLEEIHAEVDLVISATTKEHDLQEIIAFFGEINIDRLIITKLDETTGFGILLHASTLAKVPIAFVTTGQGVPEDIEVADAGKIAALILGD